MCIVILFYSSMYSVVSYRWRHARSQTSFWLYDHLCSSKCFLQHSNVASLYKKLMTLNTKFIANHFNDFGGPWAIESDLLCSVCLRLCPRNNFKVRSDLWLNSWNADILRFKFVGPGHRSKFKATWQKMFLFFGCGCTIRSDLYILSRQRAGSNVQTAVAQYIIYMPNYCIAVEFFCAEW